MAITIFLLVLRFMFFTFVYYHITAILLRFFSFFKKFSSLTDAKIFNLIVNSISSFFVEYRGRLLQVTVQFAALHNPEIEGGVYDKGWSNAGFFPKQL